MFGKGMVLGVFVCVIAFVFLLLRYRKGDESSDVINDRKKGSPMEKIKSFLTQKRKRIGNEPEEITNQATIRVIPPDGKKEFVYQTETAETKIGSSPGMHLRIENDNKVSPHHATLKKMVDDEGFYYVFINLSKINGTEYKNPELKSERNYEIMGYKDDQELNPNTSSHFYVGDTKLIIDIPGPRVRTEWKKSSASS